MTQSNFSPHNPTLQIAWDATSFQNLGFCPRYYQLTNIEGWRGSSIDLEFGTFAASSFELYQKTRLRGATKDEAALVVLRWLLHATWTEAGPWGGRYENMWHCTGVDAQGEPVKYKNRKGNAAKCPYSHKGKWFPDDAPDVCGECGAETETVKQYLPEHPAKNRETLVRTVLWYIEDQPDELDDGLRPIMLDEETPAVELSFKLPLPWTSPFGETYIICGHLDNISAFGEENFVVDNKTTTKALNSAFFASYAPHFQVDTYDLVSSMMFPSLDIRGVILDGAQTLVGGSKFGRGVYYKSEALRQEHLDTLHYWIGQAEFLAKNYGQDRDWPMNKRNCWICPFKGICSKDPSERERYLKEHFTKSEPWNPLEER